MKETIQKTILFTLVLILTGCSFGKTLTNTPIKRVEEVLLKYQTNDKEVMDDLNKVVLEDKNYNEEQRNLYIKIMKKHYSNLIYVIKDETIDGDEATVEVEIEVTDYRKILKEAEEYRKKHESEFYDKDGNYDRSLYLDYKLKSIMNVKDTAKYTLELTCTKREGQWKVDNLTNSEKEKINGIYED